MLRVVYILLFSFVLVPYYSAAQLYPTAEDILQKEIFKDYFFNTENDVVPLYLSTNKFKKPYKTVQITNKKNTKYITINYDSSFLIKDYSYLILTKNDTLNKTKINIKRNSKKQINSIVIHRYKNNPHLPYDSTYYQYIFYYNSNHLLDSVSQYYILCDSTILLYKYEYNVDNTINNYISYALLDIENCNQLSYFENDVPEKFSFHNTIEQNQKAIVKLAGYNDSSFYLDPFVASYIYNTNHQILSYEFDDFSTNYFYDSLSRKNMVISFIIAKNNNNSDKLELITTSIETYSYNKKGLLDTIKYYNYFDYNQYSINQDEDYNSINNYKIDEKNTEVYTYNSKNLLSKKRIIKPNLYYSHIVKYNNSSLINNYNFVRFYNKEKKNKYKTIYKFKYK